MKFVGSNSRDNNRDSVRGSAYNRSAQTRAPQTHVEPITMQQAQQQWQTYQKQPGRPPAPEQHLSGQENQLTPAQQAALQNIIQKTAMQREIQQRYEQTAQPNQRSNQRPYQNPNQAPPPIHDLTQRAPPIHDLTQRRPPQRYSEIYGLPNVSKKRKNKVKSAFLTILLMLVFSAAGFGGWYYWWTEHATFAYMLQPVVVLRGENIQPADFLYPTEEMERVSAAYRSPVFRPTDGRQEVSLTLTRGWRTVDAIAQLYVLTTVEQIFHEFGEPGPELKAINFITNAEAAGRIPFDVHFTEAPLLLEEYEVGTHTLHLSLNNAAFEALLTVTDTIAPTATATNKTIQIGEEVFPEDFVTDIFDLSEIESIKFVVEPDVIAHRNQIVEVEITDIHGNSDVFSGGLTILLNQEPPVIEGTDTIVITVGDSIMYLRDVTATDDFGRDISENIQVDSSLVDQHTVGEYTVIYSVVDYTGLRFEVEEKVHVVEIDMDFVHEKVDEALAGIVNDNMTQLEKVRAIHNWVQRNINYSVTRGGPATAYEGAYIALTQRRGNCYIFYSISEVMLTRAGIQNMRIERIEGTPTRHRWNLVNPDNLGWHHYDSYPTRLQLSSQMAFFTSSQAASYARQIQAINNMRDYYTYDPALYPEIVQ